ncbi:MAG: rod-binding protein [Planctomycetota bacterium]
MSPIQHSLPPAATMRADHGSPQPNPPTSPQHSALGMDPSIAAPDELRERFQEFVGQTLFGQMLSAMRSSVGEPAYLHGGRTEEIFQQQLDQQLAEELTEASADSFADPMYELFTARRR